MVAAQDSPVVPENSDVPRERYFVVTNVAQFGTLSSTDYLAECAFRLTGVITLVDTNRSLVVLQDASGAVAVNFGLLERGLKVGQRVSLEAKRCYPYIVSFPEYPFRCSGFDIRESFEAPMDWGDYHLNRMRGFLHPPATGDYTFWIASDNSSELRLSPNEEPTGARRIAFLTPFSWVGRHEWSRFPSQRSETVWLEAGRTYYIEAIQEQTTGGDHLSVAWQGPNLKQSVIQGRYLTPWRNIGEPQTLVATNGILREYWTNYSAGNLSVVTRPLIYESALSAEDVSVTFHGEGSLPKADSIVLDQRMSPVDNYRWVQVEGQVRFAAIDGDVLLLELSDGQSQMQVRAVRWDRELPSNLRNSTVSVEGVCEGVYNEKGNLVAGLIWATTINSVLPSESVETEVAPLSTGESPTAAGISTNQAMEGFYSSRGVVTFNDRVFDNDYLYVQEGTAVVSVSLKDRHYRNDLKVGQWVEFGGGLQPRKFVPVISPLAVTELGWRSLPLPLTNPAQFPAPATSEGRWSEIEGVVHTVNSNGTLSIMGKSGFVSIWLGRTPSNELSRYVDSKLRVRGVLTSELADNPTLLVPSRSFVDVEKEAPADPFGIPLLSVADLISHDIQPSEALRVKLVGAVTHRDGQSFFMEDDSGGIRVRSLGDPSVNVGDAVEVIGFPTLGEPVPILSSALVRSAGVNRPLESKKLDMDRAVSFTQHGALVHVNANLLSQKISGGYQVLELQDQKRIFEATLANNQGRLPPIAPGSRLRIVGVCDFNTVNAPASARNGMEKAAAGPLSIRLRQPSDVVVLSGPPWWTLKRTVALVGALLATLAIALLWVHLLRRRLVRQQAARLAFSRQILQGQETERQRIAINLHDSLGQNLLVIKNQIRLAMQSSTDETALNKRLNEISEVTSQSIEEVRQITHGLRPYQLDRLGLTQAIRATVGRASDNSPISFASYVDDIDVAMDKESEIHVYRIIQEAISNVVKHSSATEAAVVIKRQPGVVSLSIRDNGRGFNAEIMRPSGLHRDLGYGLTGIAERVRILRGKIFVDSKPGHGTSLTLEIPIPTAKE